MMTHTPQLIRALRWALGLLAAGAVFAIATADTPSHVSPMARIQRRTTAEAATAQNAVGELTYSTDEPGAATLRVGTSDSGTVVVSDPCAIHIAPRRKLQADEYAIRVSGEHTVYPDGSILLATNVTGTAVVTNVVTLTPVDPAVKLSSVTWDLRSGGSCGRVRTMSEDAATLETHVTSEEMPPPEPRQPGMALLRGVTVWAWTSDRRSVELDTETHPVPFRDAIGSTSLWDLRTWTTNRYDWRTAEHWSQFPAIDTVRLAGHTVHYSAGGALRSMVDAGTWTYYASGVPVIEIASGVSTNAATDELNVLAITLDGANVLLDVSASLAVPVYIETAPDLGSGEWFRAAGQTSSYPNTVSVGGLPAYRVTVPVDPAATAAFFRATATVDGGGASRSLRLGGSGTPIYIDGVRAAWTNIVVNGAALRVLAAQPDN